MKIYKTHESDLVSKLLTGIVMPRPIAWVSTRGVNNILNIAPFSYFNIVSTNPPYISISVRKEGLREKDTTVNILNNKEFVVHVVDEENIQYVNDSSYEFPSDVSEVDYLGLTKTPSILIETEGVMESKVRMECEYVTHISLAGTVLFIGKVLALHICEDILDNDKIINEKTNMLSRLAGPNYGAIGKIIKLERPKKL